MPDKIAEKLQQHAQDVAKEVQAAMAEDQWMDQVLADLQAPIKPPHQCGKDCTEGHTGGKHWNAALQAWVPGPETPPEKKSMPGGVVHSPGACKVCDAKASQPHQPASVPMPDYKESLLPMPNDFYYPTTVTTTTTLPAYSYGGGGSFGGNTTSHGVSLTFLEVDPALLAKVDKARGDTPRLEFIRAAVEDALFWGEKEG